MEYKIMCEPEGDSGEALRSDRGGASLMGATLYPLVNY